MLVEVFIAFTFVYHTQMQLSATSKHPVRTTKSKRGPWNNVAQNQPLFSQTNDAWVHDIGQVIFRRNKPINLNIFYGLKII